MKTDTIHSVKKISSRSKNVVLLAALLFSATAFAATCPDVSEITHNDQGNFTKDGWSSVYSSDSKPEQFDRVLVKFSADDAFEQNGKSLCFYNPGGAIMQQTLNFASVDHKDPAWSKISHQDKKRGEVTDYYYCRSSGSRVTDCKFTSVPGGANNPNNADPFPMK